MESLIRLLVRFLLVPLGYLAAVIAGTCVILFGAWQAGAMMLSGNPDTATAGLFGAMVAGPVLFIVMLASMWLPAAIGILISEAFAIRSWIFHALNGAISAWAGWQMLAPFDQSGVPLNAVSFVFGAGLAGGFAYWAVAGRTAGFWKPIYARKALQPPQTSPFNPPAQTKA